MSRLSIDCLTVANISKADLDDKDSLRLALKDAYAVLALTNWQELLNKEREIHQGKNIADISKVLCICSSEGYTVDRLILGA